MSANPPADHLHDEEIEDDSEHFITGDEVLEEVGEGDEDHPMDDDDLEDDENVAMEAEDDVVYEDTSIQHFPSHNGSVFAVSVHPSQPIAASGGEDDLGYLWSLEDGEQFVKLTGHTDSVTSTAFSGDGELIATGGMDGKVRIWRRVGKERWKVWEFLTELQGPDEVMVRMNYWSYQYMLFTDTFLVAEMAPERFSAARRR